MKNQLREELLALAEKILQTKQQEHLNSAQLQSLARQLYEKLTVLNFTEKIILGTDPSESVYAETPSTKVPPSEKSQEESQFSDATEEATSDEIPQEIYSNSAADLQ